MKNPEEFNYEIRTVISAINRYVEYRYEPGGFVRSVLENDLKGAFGSADMDNRRYMFEIVQYCYNEIPSICWGSKEAVNDWLNGGDQ